MFHPDFPVPQKPAARDPLARDLLFRNRASQELIAPIASELLFLTVLLLVAQI